MYEIGKVYIWRNQVGPMAILNGTECTPVAPAGMQMHQQRGGIVLAQKTDSTILYAGVNCDCYAEKGDLIRKDPPSGEKDTLSLFTKPVPETV